MSRFLTVFLLAFAAAGLSLSGLPWWTFVPLVFFLAVFLKPTPTQAFFGAFLALFLFWAGWSWMQNDRNHGLLASQIGQLLHLSPALLIGMTGLIGGLLGGMGALTGAFWPRKKKPKRRRYYR